MLVPGVTCRGAELEDKGASTQRMGLKTIVTWNCWYMTPQLSHAVDQPSQLPNGDIAPPPCDRSHRPARAGWNPPREGKEGARSKHEKNGAEACRNCIFFSQVVFCQVLTETMEKQETWLFQRKDDNAWILLRFDAFVEKEHVLRVSKDSGREGGLQESAQRTAQISRKRNN